MFTRVPGNIPMKPVTRKAANKVSKQLRNYNTTTALQPEYQRAMVTAQQWRAQHALPTENCFRMVLTNTAQFADAVLTFRLKRMKSILAKIQRTDNDYQLGTMDDIGGLSPRVGRY